MVSISRLLHVWRARGIVMSGTTEAVAPAPRRGRVPRVRTSRSIQSIQVMVGSQTRAAGRASVGTTRTRRLVQHARH